jgi:hypothetical protein
MNEDTILLATAFSVYWLTLLIVTMFSTKRKQTFFINTAIHVIYSSCLFYGLLYKSQGGSGLVWWFYLLVALTVHWLVILIYFLFRKFRSGTRKRTAPVGGTSYNGVLAPMLRQPCNNNRQKK